MEEMFILGSRRGLDPQAENSAGGGQNRESHRGTINMKFSVKLITALTAFVLLAVGLVGLTSSGSTARAAVDANVYVANEWSKLTNDPTPAATYTYAGASKTIYSTFTEVNAAQNTIAQNTIQANSNRVTIFVEDADVNASVPKSTVITSGAAFTSTPGASQIVVLSTADSPIVDADGDGLVSDDITIVSTAAGTMAIAAATAGSSTVGATVTLVSTNSATSTSVQLDWNTSLVNSLVVSVKTTQQSTAKTFSINETGASTGVFKGSIDLKDVEGTTPSVSEIEIQNGGTVTVTYSDATPASGGSAKSIATTAVAETGAPLLTVTGPTTASATQVRRPVFAGSVSDTTAGIDVSSIAVHVDTATDTSADGDTPDVDASISQAGNSPTVPAGSADGTTSTTFSYTAAADLPNVGVTTPNHVVDWQARATDLAGNVGWSDSKTSGTGSANVSTTAGSGIGNAGRGQAHTVKIDRTLPGITAVYTGLYLDSTVSPVVRKADKKTSIEININDSVDSSTIQNTDFEVVVGGVTQVPTEATVGGTGFTDRVFLTVASDLATNAVPTVRIVGSIADTAGNTTSTGSKVGKDALAPTITVALSGGSSATKPATLTKLAMTITITSDENLSADPTVGILNTGSASESTVTAVNQGSKTWIAAFSGGSATGDTATGRKKSVVVMANDAATTVSQSSATLDGDTVLASSAIVIGQTQKGNASTTHASAITFTLDKTAPTLTLSPANASSTSDDSPFVRWNFGEAVTVSKAEFGLNSATVLENVTADLGTSDNKVYLRANSNLALGKYKATGTATDLAGNKATGLSATFTIIKRAEFKMTLLPGTTLVSFPLTPSDSSINAVFSPAGIVSVSSYDTATGTFTSSVRDAESGDLAGNLASVNSGTGYIVVADAVSALVVPIPSLGASSIPPSIPVASGWNLIGVTDVTGDNTGKLRQPGADIAQTRGTYFPTKVTHVYDWDATGKVWNALATGDNVLVGDAYWAFSSAAVTLVP